MKTTVRNERIEVLSSSSDLSLPQLARLKEDRKTPTVRARDYYHAPRAHRQGPLRDRLTMPAWLQLSDKVKIELTSLSKQVSPTYLLQTLNPTEYFYPVTWRKAAYLSVYTGIGVGLYFLNRHFDIVPKIAEGLRWDNIALMAVIYGLEPSMMLFIMCMAYIPDAYRPVSDTADLEAQRSESNTSDTALVIPSHETPDDTLYTVLNSALRHFKPEQIFLIDNGNSKTPKDLRVHNTVARINPSINYVWSPIGSKNVAQFVGFRAARDYKYVLTVDDDVSVPEFFRAPTHLITNKTKAVALPIQATDENGNRPLFVAWQNAEYGVAALNKLMESKTCGVLYPHGAVSFWDNQTGQDALRRHNLIFYAEDVKLGFSLQELGKHMAIDASQLFSTVAPSTLLGKAPNFVTQRSRSWEMGRQVVTWKFVQGIFGRINRRSIGADFIQRFSHTYALASNVIDWIRVPVIVATATRPDYWIRFGALTALPAVSMGAYKYLKTRHRPDLQPALSTVLTFPIYKQLYAIVSVFGALRSILHYAPNQRRPKTIGELEKTKDERAIWDDPRFDDNPRYNLEAMFAEAIKDGAFIPDAHTYTAHPAFVGGMVTPDSSDPDSPEPVTPPAQVLLPGRNRNSMSIEPAPYPAWI